MLSFCELEKIVIRDECLYFVLVIIYDVSPIFQVNYTIVINECELVNILFLDMLG